MITDERVELSHRARLMREEFDTGFAEMPGQVVADTEDVLLVRIGDEERVVPLGEVAGVAARPLITAVPTTQPAMIGLISDRGNVTAVWDLGQLLGLPAENPRWLVIPAIEKSVAFTFDHFAGFLRVEQEQIADDQRLSLAGLVETIRELAGTGSRGTT
ncbi:chemotaxis protein CheW [Kineosporia sp. J2-2]|uniref:Chemotaxis protein CheW n=1 Tax=Kineosporia corallincola TaxID=2835133 RepID=A0ABS5TS38_9ACTN|nr:chemotaxis protein CheW [Kineosporia corallincola]MBT0773614.1 chemotaxis protein CheW [Kineosporia corallincola]